MIDKKEFEKIRKELSGFEEKREKLILESRVIIKVSKQVIYAVHRSDFSSAEKFLKELKDKVKSLPVEKFDTNISGVAYQEFVEAITFYEFMKNDKLITAGDLVKFGVNSESYLLGLCDLTGELGRASVNSVINDKIDAAKNIRDCVASIYEEFLKFDFRNGELRKKSDSIKWNLEKIEDLLYDLKIKGRK